VMNDSYEIVKAVPILGHSLVICYQHDLKLLVLKSPKVLSCQILGY
jgi:hypothetical protein